MAITVEDFLMYVKETKSKHTFKEYRIGLEKLSEGFGKTKSFAREKLWHLLALHASLK